MTSKIAELSQPLAAALLEDDDEAAELMEEGNPQVKAATLAEKVIEKVMYENGAPTKKRR